MSYLPWGRLAGAVDERVAAMHQELRSSSDNAIDGAKALLDMIADELYRLLSTYDPIPIISRVAMSTLTSEDTPDAYDVFGTEARIQHMMGVALAAPAHPEKRPGAGEVQRAIDLVYGTFLLEKALLAAMASQGVLSVAQLSLRHEALEDRFQGYEAHLQTILAAVFEPIRRECEEALGWCPSDLHLIKNAIVQLRQRRLDSNWPDLHAAIVEGMRISESHAVAAYERLAEPLALGLARVSAEDTAYASGLKLATVRSALTSLATSWGDDPFYRRPIQHCPFRRRGVVALPEGTFFVPIPSCLAQEVTFWFSEETRRRGLAALANRYFARRDKATEELTKTAFSAPFTSNRVLGPLWYGEPATEAEVDAVVVVPRDALVIECKAHSLTDPGRRGAPDRLQNRSNRLIVDPLRQSARCVDHLRKEGSLRDRRGLTVTIDVETTSALPRVAVSIERIDPLSGTVAELAMSADVPPTCVIPLADVLLITEVLDDPASLWDYLEIRSAIAGISTVQVFAEGDLLGLYLEEGSTALHSVAAAASEHSVIIGPGAMRLNAHYLWNPANSKPRPPRPTSLVPVNVRDALRSELQADRSDWTQLVKAVFAQPTKTWSRWSDLVRKADRKRIARRRILDVHSPALRLVYEPLSTSSGSCHPVEPLRSSSNPTLLVRTS